MARWKWIAGSVAGGVLLVIGVPAALIGSAFVGISPIVDGQALGAVTTVKDGYVSAFFAEAADGGVILVDAGMDPQATALKAALAAKGRAPADVRALFLTHGHGDHVGGCAAFPDATVYALAAEVPVITGEHAARGPLTRWMTNDGTCRVDRPLTDGEVVDLGGTSVTVYALPGHTAGSAAYVVDGVLLLGDAASATAKGTVRGPPWVFSDDTSQAAASLSTLAARVPSDVRWMAFAHTGPLEGTDALRALARP